MVTFPEILDFKCLNGKKRDGTTLILNDLIKPRFGTLAFISKIILSLSGTLSS
jgi:hypothetical protein